MRILHHNHIYKLDCANTTPNNTFHQFLTMYIQIFPSIDLRKSNIKKNNSSIKYEYYHVIIILTKHPQSPHVMIMIVTSAYKSKPSPPGLTTSNRSEWIWHQVSLSLCLCWPQGDMGLCSHHQSRLWHLFSVELIKGQRGPLHRQHVHQTKTFY